MDELEEYFESEIDPMIQIILEDIHEDIDSERTLVVRLKQFEDKLAALDYVIGHVNYNYDHLPWVHGLFIKVSDLLVGLEEESDELRKKLVHLLAFEQATEKEIKDSFAKLKLEAHAELIKDKKSIKLHELEENLRKRLKKYVLDFCHKEKEKIKTTDSKVSTLFRRFIQTIQKTIVKIRGLFSKIKAFKFSNGDNLTFSPELEGEDELKTIIEKTFHFFIAYQAFFKKLAEEIK